MSLHRKNRVSILNIENPSSFWIAENDSKAFVSLVHEELRKNMSTVKIDSNQREFIAVTKPHEHIFYRAEILNIRLPFASCFLIDTGEKISIRFSDCKKITSEKLQQLAPLAKHCKLFGIISNSET